MKKYKVFVADANSKLVTNLERKLKSSPEIEYIQSGNTKESSGELSHLSPDIITFDMFLPQNRDFCTQKNQGIDTIIAKRLTKLGMPSGLSGYRYMITAIKTVLHNENSLDCVTKILYPDVAKKHQSTPQRIEKAIRHAIKVTWANETVKNMDGYYFYIKQGRNYPTNTQFIAEMSRHIKMFPNHL